jgi:hypothetical protein
MGLLRYQLFSELRGHAAWESRVDMAQEDDDTVSCHVQMSLARGKELLQLVTALRESRTVHDWNIPARTAIRYAEKRLHYFRRHKKGI